MRDLFKKMLTVYYANIMLFLTMYIVAVMLKGLCIPARGAYVWGGEILLPLGAAALLVRKVWIHETEEN